jgi:hypothetical protein
MMAIPAFRMAAHALRDSLRVTPGTPVRLVSDDDLALPAIDSMLQEHYAIARQLSGASQEDALLEMLVRALVHRHTTTRALYRTLTVYAFPSRDKAEPGFDFVFLADAYDGEWPYLVGRSVLTDGKRNLDEILESHPDGSTDEFFRDAEMGELLRLVVNAVLYTTSADYRKEWREPAPPAHAPNRAILSGDGVYYLPGRITIGPQQAGDAQAGTRTGTTIVQRFWVRGHWRRPHTSWQDQRVRWIAPYLKGPEMAAIAEREYALGAVDP